MSDSPDSYGNTFNAFFDLGDSSTGISIIVLILLI